MQILTEKGFKDYEGFVNQGEKEVFQVNFENGEYLICTDDHRLLLDDGRTYEFVSNLKEGDEIYGNGTITSIIPKGNESVYDALNVEETHSYWTNGCISHNCLFLDEFAFVQNATEFYTSTYPVISSGQNTKVIITSTANGIGNMYYQLWEGAVQGINEYSPFRVDWWDVPGRDEEWKRQTIANTSETQFKQEFQNQFLGTSNTLIESDTLLGLQTRPPEQSIHSGSLRIYEKPIKGHVYLMSVDVSQGRGQDYSAFSVVDITSRPFKQVVAFNDNKISPLLLPNILLKVAQEYNNAIALIENNGPGQVVCNSMYYDFEYDNTFVESAIKAGGIGVTTTRKIKSVGMSNLKDLIESGNLQIWDSDTVGELCTFEARGSSYEGKANSHDDLVMSLVLFAWFVSTEAFGEFNETQLRDMVFSQKMQEIEDEMLDFGFVSSNNDQFDALPSEYAEMKDSMEFWSNL